jgi:hypothetical protein
MKRTALLVSLATLVVLGLSGRELRAQYPAPCYQAPAPAPVASAPASFAGASYSLYGPTATPAFVYPYRANYPGYSSYYYVPTYYPSGYVAVRSVSGYANPGPYYYTSAYPYTPGYYSYYYTPGYFRY